MAELKQGGKGENSIQPKPRLGDILDRDELTRQFRKHIEGATGCPNIINWEEIKRLILLGADPNGLLGAVTPPLFHAADKGLDHICQFLLENGADPNFQTDFIKKTALMIAASWNYTNICKMLVEHGADICIKDNEGNDAVWYAKLPKENDALRYLSEVMLRKMLMERSDAFLLEFNKCIA
jgi:hypothetical protein